MKQEITNGRIGVIDALRGFAIFHTRPNAEEVKGKRVSWSRDMWEDYATADEAGKKYLKGKYGEPL